MNANSIKILLLTSLGLFTQVSAQKLSCISDSDIKNGYVSQTVFGRDLMTDTNTVREAIKSHAESNVDLVVLKHYIIKNHSSTFGWVFESLSIYDSILRRYMIQKVCLSGDASKVICSIFPCGKKSMIVQDLERPFTLYAYNSKEDIVRDSLKSSQLSSSRVMFRSLANDYDEHIYRIGIKNKHFDYRIDVVTCKKFCRSNSR